MRSFRGVVVTAYVLLTVLAALFLLPFYVLLRNAFSTPQQMAAAQWQWIRIDNRLSKIILGMTLLTFMVQAAVTFIPSFVRVSSLGWISTLRGLIIPVLFSAFATFLLRQYFLGFPNELE